MADFIVGISDGYHSIAYAGGLLPAIRQPFSISSPSALERTEKDAPANDASLAEIRAGVLADIKT